MKLTDIKALCGRIEHGDWVDDLPRLPGLRVKARGLRNSEYVRLERVLVGKVPRARCARGLSQTDSDAILATCLAKTVLLDWEGLTDDEGKPLAFDVDLAEKLLSDPQYLVFREAVIHAANVVGEIDAGQPSEDSQAA